MDAMKTAAETRSMPTDLNGLLKIPGNRYRVGIIISVPVGASAFVQPGSADGQSAGILLNASMTYIELSAERYGDAVAGPINVQNTAVAQISIAVVEFVVAP